MIIKGRRVKQFYRHAAISVEKYITDTTWWVFDGQYAYHKDDQGQWIKLGVSTTVYIKEPLSEEESIQLGLPIYDN